MAVFVLLPAAAPAGIISSNFFQHNVLSSFWTRNDRSDFLSPAEIHITPLLLYHTPAKLQAKVHKWITLSKETICPDDRSRFSQNPNRRLRPVMHHIFCGQQMPAAFPVADEIWISGKITIQIRYICPDFRQYFFMKPPKKARKEDARWVEMQSF